MATVQLFVQPNHCFSCKFVAIFQGVNLTKALTPAHYTVFIGDQLCSKLEVTLNSISCQPPPSAPEHTVVRVSTLFHAKNHFYVIFLRTVSLLNLVFSHDFVPTWHILG